VVWEDVARHTHSARQTDDSEEDENDHFETTKKKNPNAGKTSSSVGQSIDISNPISSSALKTSPRFIIAYIIIIMPSEDQQQQQQQQQHRSTARRDQLTAYQTSAQASWSTSKAFEVNADAEKKIKFFGNFPYPYMNGLLHLGHAFSLSKLVRLNVHEHSLSDHVRRREKKLSHRSTRRGGVAWDGGLCFR
tara:strand:- start:3184 stop:3756 length:573 start_codon:yes stop_codon:yes gene_type:complete